MWRLVLFGYRYSYFIAAATLLLAFFSFQFAVDVRVDVSTDALVSAESPERMDYEKVRDIFGSDQIAAIYASDRELWDPRRLKKLKSLHEILSRLPYVESVGSLNTYPDIRHENGFLETDPILGRIPDDAETLARRRASAVGNPLLIGNAISADGNATLITLFLSAEKTALLDSREINDQIEAILLRYRGDFDELTQVGGPAVQTQMMDLLRSDQIFLLPLASGIILVILAYNLGSLIGGFIPILNAFIATAWTLALMFVLDIPLNLLNYILPVLILVIGATEDVHFIHAFKVQYRSSGSGTKAIGEAGREGSLAITLTGITTILGFAATTLSDLPILRFFGIAAIIGMSVRLSITFLFLPACLRFFKDHLVTSTGHHPGTAVQSRAFDRWSQAVPTFIMRHIVPHPRLLIGLIAAIVIPAAFFASKIKTSNDLLSFLRPDSEIVQRVNRVADRMAGTKVINLSLFGNPGDYVSPTALDRLRSIAEYIRSQPDCDTALSFADFIARINQQIRKGDPAQNIIPEKSSTIQQLLLFSHPKDFAAYVTPDYANANIVIRCNINDSAKLNAFAAAIRKEMDSERFGNVVYKLTGKSLVVASAVESVTKTQIFSLGLMSFILFAIVSLLFLSFRCGILTVLANLVSIVLIFGIMGLFGIPLNVGTCMVAAITLGIAIDDTLHLLVRYSRELKTHRDERKGIEASLRAQLHPILSTSLALAGGFAILYFSSFQPVRQFGLLSAGVILLALSADLLITPVLIASVRLVTIWDILGLKLRKALIDRSPFFQNLTTWQAKKIILASDIENCPAGSVVIRKGDTGDKMYIVLSGELEVVVYRNGEKLPLEPFKMGDIFGEVGLVSKVRRTADVIALTNTRLLVLDADSLLRLRRFSPYLSSHIFYNLSRILGERLAERN